MQIRFAVCVVYLMIARLFGLSANVKLTTDGSVFSGGQGSYNFVAELAFTEGINILLSSLTRELCLEL